MVFFLLISATNDVNLKSLAIHICEVLAEAKCPIDKNDMSFFERSDKDGFKSKIFRLFRKKRIPWRFGSDADRFKGQVCRVAPRFFLLEKIQKP